MFYWSINFRENKGLNKHVGFIICVCLLPVKICTQIFVLIFFVLQPECGGLSIRAAVVLFSEHSEMLTQGVAASGECYWSREATVCLRSSERIQEFLRVTEENGARVEICREHVIKMSGVILAH